MNELIKLNETTTATMTSREIAELTGKQHKNVLRDIDGMIESLGSEMSAGVKSDTYVDSSGKSNRQFLLDRDSSICLVTGYDVTARMRIILNVGRNWNSKRRQNPCHCLNWRYTAPSDWWNWNGRKLNWRSASK